MLKRTFPFFNSYRQIVDKFWSPFAEGKMRGPDVTCYKARENLLALIGNGSRRIVPLATPSLHEAQGVPNTNTSDHHSGASSSSAAQQGGGSTPPRSNGNGGGGGTSAQAGHVLPSPEPLRAMMMEGGGGKVYGAEERMEVAADDFMCQVNGIVGSVDTIENMFITILTGFDIVKVVMDAAPDDAPSRHGTIYVHHCRPFLGWQPTNTVIFFPFYMFLEKGEGEGNSLSHLVLRFEFNDALRDAGCPDEVMQTLTNREALRMLAALRRVRVKPEAISWEALMKAAADKSTFDKAIGPFN